MNNLQKTYTTSDLSLAAYLLLHGLTLKSAQKSTGKFEFILFDPDDKSEGLSLAFIGSQFSVYDGYLRTLRGMLHRN